MKTFFFVFRVFFAWSVVCLFAVILWATVLGSRGPGVVLGLAILFTLMTVTVRTFSHVHRVRLVAGRVDDATLGSRHRRQIEIPFPAEEAFDIVETAIRELPYVDKVESARGSLQVHARVKRLDPYISGKQG